MSGKVGLCIRFPPVPLRAFAIVRALLLVAKVGPFENLFVVACFSSLGHMALPLP